MYKSVSNFTLARDPDSTCHKLIDRSHGQLSLQQIEFFLRDNNLLCTENLINHVSHTRIFDSFRESQFLEQCMQQGNEG